MLRNKKSKKNKKQMNPKRQMSLKTRKIHRSDRLQQWGDPEVTVG